MISNVNLLWFLAGLAFTVRAFAGPAAPPQEPLRFVTGGAPLEDPARADITALTRTAAMQARGKLGASEPPLVLVYGFLPYDHQKMLSAVVDVFPKSLVMGSPAYGVITGDGNVHSLGMLAVGGPVSVSFSSAPVAAGLAAAAKRLAGDLSLPSRQAVSNGLDRLVILVGDCTNPRDITILNAFARELGPEVPVFGGAGAGGAYVQGLWQTNQVAAVLLVGSFDTGFSIRGNRGVRSREDLLQASQEAVAQAVVGLDAAGGLVLAANCVSRREALGSGLEKELPRMRMAAPGASVFGFFGNGEIGRLPGGTNNVAVTHSLAITVLVPRRDTPPVVP